MKTRTTWEDWQEVETTNPVAQRMRLARDLCQTVVSGGLQAAYLSGPPGIGKNMAVSDALKSAGVTAVKANPVNYLDLLAKLAEARSRRVPLWLDEADVIFRTDRMFNLLKVATSDDPRDRVYNGQCVDVPLLVCTNNSLDPKGIAEWCKPNLVDHARALFNRSQPVCIEGSVLELWEYSVFVAQTTKMLWNDSDGDGIPVGQANEALEWFTRHVFRLDVVSPRTLKKAADLIARSEKANPTIPASVADFTLAAMVVSNTNREEPRWPVIVPRPKVAA